VVAQQQMVSCVADRGPRRTGVTTDGEEQLMLLARETNGGRLFVAPTQKPPQPGAEGK
jgi:hypothetical protein